MASITTRYRLWKTAFLYAVFASFGLVMSLGGPSIPDLCDRMDITEEQISIAFSVMSIMWTVGAILFGPIIDRFQNYVDVFLGMALLVMATCTLIKPYSPLLWVYITASAVEALSYAVLDLSSNVMVFITWGEKSNSPVQGLHAAWGLGFALGPLLIRPFLGPDTVDDEAINGTMTTMPPDVTTMYDVTEAPLQESRIEIAYIITACFTLVLAVIAFILHAVGIPKGVQLHLKPKESFRSVFSVGNLAGGDTCFASLMLLFIALFYFGNSGRENVFNTWLFNYAISSELDFTKQEAALLDAAAKFSLLGGRVISAVIAVWVPIQITLMIEVYLVLVFVVCMGLLGTQTKVYLWTFSCLANAFAAPIWAGGLAWADRYIVFGGIVLVVMNLGAGVSGIIFNYLSGWLFTNADANAVMYLLFICAVIMCVLIVIMQVVGSRHGERFVKEEAPVSPDPLGPHDKPALGQNGVDDNKMVLDKTDEVESGVINSGVQEDVTVWSTDL